MGIMEKLAAQRAKIREMQAELPAAPAAPAVPDGWTQTPRTKRGKPVYEVYAICTKPRNPVASLLDRLPMESQRHEEGDTCPHCLGTGRYNAHKGHFHNEKCYRCNGKGLLDARDLAFLDRRKKGAGPICHIVTA